MSVTCSLLDRWHVYLSQFICYLLHQWRHVRIIKYDLGLRELNQPAPKSFFNLNISALSYVESLDGSFQHIIVTRVKCDVCDLLVTLWWDWVVQMFHSLQMKNKCRPCPSSRWSMCSARDSSDHKIDLDSGWVCALAQIVLNNPYVSPVMQ